MAKNPALEVSAPKSDKPLPKTCDAETLDQLLRVGNNEEDLLLRDVAILN